MLKIYSRYAILVAYWVTLTRVLVTANPWGVFSRELALRPPLDLSFEPLSWLVHLSAYALLGILIRWSVPLEEQRKVRSALFILSYFHGGASEILQYFIPGRWPGLMDMLFNSIGLFTVQRWHKYPMSKKEKEVKMAA